jgi:hypothetical protein
MSEEIGSPGSPKPLVDVPMGEIVAVLRRSEVLRRVDVVR